MLPIGCGSPTQESSPSSNDASELESVLNDSHKDHGAALKCFEEFRACVKKAAGDPTALTACKDALRQCLPDRPPHPGGGHCHGDGGVGRGHGDGGDHDHGGGGHHPGDGGVHGHHGDGGCHGDGGHGKGGDHGKRDGGIDRGHPDGGIHRGHDGGGKSDDDDLADDDLCDDEPLASYDEDEETFGPHPIGLGGPAAQMCKDQLKACLSAPNSDRETCLTQMHTCVHDAIAANFKKFCDDLVKACEACAEPQGRCDALAAKCAAGFPFPDHP